MKHESYTGHAYQQEAHLILGMTSTMGVVVWRISAMTARVYTVSVKTIDNGNLNAEVRHLLHVVCRWGNGEALPEKQMFCEAAIEQAEMYSQWPAPLIEAYVLEKVISIGGRYQCVCVVLMASTDDCPVALDMIMHAMSAHHDA